MTVEQFVESVYGILYSGDEYRYIRVSNTSNGITIGVLGWSGYDAIKLLQTIITTLGPVKSSIILGYKLRRKLLSPYIDYNNTNSTLEFSNSELGKISCLLNTKTGMNCQDVCVMSDIAKYTNSVIHSGIVNCSIAAFIVYQYMNWVPGFSDYAIAICRLRNKDHMSLHDIGTELDELFNSKGCIGKQSKRMFYKISLYMSGVETIFIQKEKA